MPPTDPNQDAKNIQSMLTYLSKVSKVMETTMDKMLIVTERFGDLMAGANKNMEDTAANAKLTASHLDAARTTLTDMTDLIKKTNQGIFSGQTLGGMRRQLEEVYNLTKKISKEANFGGVNQLKAIKFLETLKASMDKVDEEAKKAGKSMASALGPKLGEELSRAMKDAHIQMKSVRDEAEKLRNPIQAIGKSFRETFGSVGPLSFLSRMSYEMERMRDRAAAIKKEVDARKQIGREQFAERIAPGASVVQRFLKEAPKSQEEYDAMTPRAQRLLGIRAKKIMSMPDKELRTQVGDVAGTTGITGMYDKIKGMNAIRKMAKGIGAGDIPEDAIKGLGTMEAGGGSMAVGAGEEAAGGMGEIAGGPYAMIAMEVSKYIKKGFDMWADSNKEVFTKLGGGGIFGGNQGAMRAMDNVRRNLTPPSIYSTFGETYTKNLQIAEAITKFGISVSDLAESNNTTAKNFIGGAGQTPGRGIGATAYGVAKLTGMDEVATTERILKLMTQYHQSLESSDDFFQRLLKDTKAAGFTTSKYIQIIDSVSEQFGHMARSIETVTATLRVLGQTGTMSAEEVEDAMKAMIGPEKAPEQKAFLAIQMAQNPEYRNRLLSQAQAQVHAGAEEIRRTLRDAKISEGVIAGLGNLEAPDVGEAQQALNKANDIITSLPEDIAPALREAAGGAITEQFNRLGRLASTQQLLTGGVAGAVNYAFQPFQEDAFQKIISNMEAMTYALSKTGVGGGTQRGAFEAFMAHPEDVMAKNAPLFTQLAQALGTTKDALVKMWRPIRSAANVEARRLVGGVNVGVKEYEEAAQALGKGELKGADAAKFIKGMGTDALTNKLAGKVDFLTSLPDIAAAMNRGLKELAEAKDKADQRQKEQEAATSTRNTADVFAAAFEYLFNRLYTLITDIAEMLEKIQGVGHGMGRHLTTEEQNAIVADIGTEAQPGIERTDLDKIKQQREISFANYKKLRAKNEAAGEKHVTPELLKLYDEYNHLDNLIKDISVDINNAKGYSREKEQTAHNKLLAIERGTAGGITTPTTDEAIPPAAQPGTVPETPAAKATGYKASIKGEKPTTSVKGGTYITNHKGVVFYSIPGSQSVQGTGGENTPAGTHLAD